MDRIDRAQKRLSGICDKCDYPLAEHIKQHCPVKYYFDAYTGLFAPFYYDDYDYIEELLEAEEDWYQYIDILLVEEELSKAKGKTDSGEDNDKP